MNTEPTTTSSSPSSSSSSSSSSSCNTSPPCTYVKEDTIQYLANQFAMKGNHSAQSSISPPPLQCQQYQQYQQYQPYQSCQQYQSYYQSQPSLYQQSQPSQPSVYQQQSLYQQHQQHQQHQQPFYQSSQPQQQQQQQQQQQPLYQPLYQQPQPYYQHYYNPTTPMPMQRPMPSGVTTTTATTSYPIHNATNNPTNQNNYYYNYNHNNNGVGVNIPKINNNNNNNINYTTATTTENTNQLRNGHPSNYNFRNLNAPIFDEQQKFFTSLSTNTNETMEDEEEKQTYQWQPIAYGSSSSPSNPSTKMHSIAELKTTHKEVSINSYWVCEVCTYHNNLDLTYCEMCGINNPTATMKNGQSISKFDNRNGIPSKEIITNRTSMSNSNARVDENKDVEKFKKAALGQMLIKSSSEQVSPPRVALDIKNNIKKENLISNGSINGISNHSSNNRTWTCGHCTFAENPLTVPICQLCGSLPLQKAPSPQPPLVSTDKIVKLDVKNQIASEPNIKESKSDPMQMMTSTNLRTNLEPKTISSQVLHIKPPVSAPPDLSVADLVGTCDPSFTIEHENDQNVNSAEKNSTDMTSHISTHKTNEVEKKPNVTKWKFWQQLSGKIEIQINPNTTKIETERRMSRERVQSIDIQDENAASTKFSIAQLPSEEVGKITQHLSQMKTKKVLQHELQKTIENLEKRLKHYEEQITTLDYRINTIREEMSADMNKWQLWHIIDLQITGRDYYNNTISFFQERIIMEKLHSTCLKEKLNKLKSAQKKIETNDSWSVEDVRQNVEAALHTAWKIRLSNDAPERYQKILLLKQIMESCKEEYDRQKALLDKKTISFEERKENIVTFLQSILNQYESQKMAILKHYQLGNLSNENYYYHAYDAAEQETFNSFILDQRTKEGRITTRWLQWIVKKQNDVSLESLCDFMCKLSCTFLDTYQLSRSQYYECIRIFVYRCVLGQPSVQHIISKILTSRFQELNELDKTYRRKTFWMRTLKPDHLQINKVYWFVPLQESNTNGNRLNPSDTYNSQSILPKYSSVPYAEAINMIGGLEDSNEIYKSPDKGVNILLEVMKMVNDIAMKYFETNKKLEGVEDPKALPLGNDDLFPIVVYCVIQSRLENPHIHIRFIELVLPEENATMGQAGFCLSVIKAAVQYVVNATPGDFGLDADIDSN